MIIHLKPEVGSDDALELASISRASVFHNGEHYVLVSSSSVKHIDPKVQPFAQGSWTFDDDMQLSSRKYQDKRSVMIGDVELGGMSNNCIVISGPCSVESKSQIDETAAFLKKLNIKALRGGCYKPRTSPYSFQGLGLEGLKLLKEMRETYGMSIVSEVRDATHIEDVIEYADVVQIGAKSMYDHGILKRCGEIRKPVLLKRGFGTTLQELVQASEFILSGGNPNVILCERGIRTFETKTRFTLDLCGVAWLKEYSNLPVVLDPSHALGYRYGLGDLSRACVAMGVDGLLIETHPSPEEAKSDAKQQVDFNQFEEIHRSLSPVAEAVGKKIV